MANLLDKRTIAISSSRVEISTSSFQGSSEAEVYGSCLKKKKKKKTQKSVFVRVNKAALIKAKYATATCDWG